MGCQGETDPKRTRNGPETEPNGAKRSRNGAKRSRNGPKSSFSGWDGHPKDPPVLKIVRTTAVAKYYGFGRRTIFSTEGSFGQGVCRGRGGGGGVREKENH